MNKEAFITTYMAQFLAVIAAKDFLEKKSDHIFSDLVFPPVRCFVRQAKRYANEAWRKLNE